MTTALQSASVNSLYKVRSVELRTLVSGETKTRAKPGGWYTEALYLARSYLERQGHDADRAIPMEPDRPDQLLRGFKAHAWRRLWATKLERLGYGKSTSKGDFDLDRHVNFMGSWTILGGGIREERYVRLDPGVLVAISRVRGCDTVSERACPVRREAHDRPAGPCGAGYAASSSVERRGDGVGSGSATRIPSDTNAPPVE